MSNLVCRTRLGQIKFVAVQHETVGERWRLSKPPTLPSIMFAIGLIRVRVTGWIQVIRPIAGFDQLVEIARIVALGTVIIVRRHCIFITATTIDILVCGRPGQTPAAMAQPQQSIRTEQQLQHGPILLSFCRPCPRKSYWVFFLTKLVNLFRDNFANFVWH